MTTLAPTAPEARRVPNAVLGMLFVVAAETMFFVGLVFVALQVRRAAAVWPPEGAQALDPWLLGANTLLLLASSITAHRAMRGLQGAGFRAGARWAAATIALGSAFLVGQWAQFVQLGGWRPAEGMYGTLFEMLAGFHGLHALAGLVIWTLLLVRARAATRPEAVAVPAWASALYWHFVTVVWVGLLAVWLLP